MEGVNEVQGKREKTRPPRGAARRSIHSHVHSHPFEVSRQAVQLYLEEGFSAELIAREMGVGQRTLSKWVKPYRDHGEPRPSWLFLSSSAVVTSSQVVSKGPGMRFAKLRKNRSRQSEFQAVSKEFLWYAL